MNKAELKEKLEQKKEAAGKAQLFPVVSIYDYVIGAVDQLDEARPNLSGKYELKEFLDRVLDERHYDSFNEVYNDIISFIDDQLDETEQAGINVGLYKPIIPDFAGEWIENAKEDGCSLSKAFWLIFSNIKNTSGNVTENWINDNAELFAIAWLYGFTVEKKKYIVKLGKCYLGSQLSGDNLVFNKGRAFIYTNKFLAEHSAETVGGEVEEVTN